VKVSGKSTTIAGETYQVLRTKILAAEIAPGTKFRTNELCTRFDVSLAAVREALTQLMGEGLVLAEAHRGYTVAPISIDDLEDLTRVRIEIENLCLAWSIEKGELDWESEVIAATHRLSRTFRSARDGGDSTEPAWAAAHDRYHSALVSACGSPRLLQIRRKLYDQSERYRKLEASLPRNRSPDDEHARITEAVLARDAPRATRLMKEHISLTSENILKALTKKEAQLLRASNRTGKTRRRGPRA
jgi:DNA-binding GntR family transcriptional regulator